MKSAAVRIRSSACIGSMFVCSVAFGQLGTTVPNWTVPSHHGAITTMGDVTFMLPFIGVTPCRIVDTRTAPGPFGGPAIAGGTSRNSHFPPDLARGCPPA